ncbi:MAG: ABC-2 transporter permease [Defluviitaleaceae bacterium]|nr:ABC-2 transporter permease [Defluviitaleaceae bacterium]
MRKIKNVVMLDILTARPGFNAIALIINLSIMAVIFAFQRDFVVVVFLLMLFMDGYVALPFSLGEMANMDALYVTLNISRKELVRARYVYTAIIILGTTLLTMSLLGIGRLFEIIFDLNLNTFLALQVLGIYFIISVIIQAILLPNYFKFTIIKSGAISTIPFLVIMIASFTFMLMWWDSISPFIENLSNPLFLTGFIISVLLIFITAIYISYRLSLRFYLQREIA